LASDPPVDPAAEVDRRLHAIAARLYGPGVLARGFLTMSEQFWNVREALLKELARELPPGLRSRFTDAELRERAEACIEREQAGVGRPTAGSRGPAPDDR
jgi:hypothetical protein